MQLTRLRRSAAIIPVALTLALFLAAGPAMAQPASGKTDSHSSTPDDPALGTPAPPAEEDASAMAPKTAPSRQSSCCIISGTKLSSLNSISGSASTACLGSFAM